MTEKIRPALTPEEWERGLAADGGAPKDPGEARFNHGIAAIALYGQPFGFTREDVAMLRVVARLHPQASNLVIGTAATPEVAASLADRIEALLPPE